MSAFMRITIGATAAVANSPEPAVEPAPIQTNEPTMVPSASLLNAFKDREARLAAREAQFADRMQALRVAEAELTEQLAALQRAEKALSDTIARADTASQSDLDRLTTVYENMAPKDAAALFEQMPPPFAAGFLGMMEATAAAKIMAGLSPETAYSFSVVLAGRNANVPRQ